MKAKIRKGDLVQVISGTTDDKGKQGEVIRLLPKKDRVVVQELNMRKKHQGQVQTQGRNIAPGIIEFEGPMHISNVMLVCPKCKKPTRVGFRREEKKSVRVCKKCGADID
jgi:large subunit ribosomal protein L24